MSVIVKQFYLYLKHNVKIMMFIAIIDAVTSQIYLTHFYNGFRISVSVLILPVFYYFYRNIHPVVMAFWIGLFGLIFRGFIGIGFYGSFFSAFMADYNIFFFDLTYGILFYLLFYISKEQPLSKWVVVVWFCDFFSNFVELISRFGFNFAFQTSVLDSLFTVALIRSIIATGVVFLIRYYKIILLKEQKMEKYKVMYNVMADLKSEVYYMQENMDHIEDVMSDAYHLYEHLSTDSDSNARQVSLRIAKDVHEIKKNYIKVIDGIGRIGIEQHATPDLDLKEIIELLEDYVRQEVMRHNITFKLEYKVQSTLRVTDHFLMMSMLRNLCVNSIEALVSYETEQAKVIKLKCHEEGDLLIVEISDNGPGIRDKELDYIFSPGYSTKFDPETGDIYRGLGLTLVKDIVSSNFVGDIQVRTSIDSGTSFTISIPKAHLEVDA